MKKILLLFIGFYLLPAFAGSYSAPAISPVGKIPLTSSFFPSASPYGAGFIGETKLAYVTNASAIAITSTSTITTGGTEVTHIDLSAGVWLITGAGYVKGTGTTSFTIYAFSTSLSAANISGNSSLIVAAAGAVPPAGLGIGGPVVSPPTYLSSAGAPLRVFLNCAATFTISTAACYGNIYAVRIQ